MHALTRRDRIFVVLSVVFVLGLIGAVWAQSYIGRVESVRAARAECNDRRTPWRWEAYSWAVASRQRKRDGDVKTSRNYWRTSQVDDLWARIDCGAVHPWPRIVGFAAHPQRQVVPIPSPPPRPRPWP